MVSLAGMGQGGGVVRLSGGSEAVGWASEKATHRRGEPLDRDCAEAGA